MSEDERVGGNMGERRLPRVQLLPKVRATIPEMTPLLFAYIFPPKRPGSELQVPKVLPAVGLTAHLNAE